MNKGEMTRQRIIAEAAPLFNQRGFEGCSMQDVLDATGLEKGGLYRHFASKEELAVEAFRYATARSTRTRTEGIEEVEGAVERLRFMVRRFVETPSMTPGGCVLMNTAIDCDDGNLVLRQMALEGIQAWKGRLEKIVAEGLERGEIRKGVEPRRVANMVVGALEGAFMVSRLEGDNVALEDVRESLDAVLDGLAA
jgi:TetR/AcrR family transcriptional repressor of nem operon